MTVIFVAAGGPRVPVGMDLVATGFAARNHRGKPAGGTHRLVKMADKALKPICATVPGQQALASLMAALYRT